MDNQPSTWSELLAQMSTTRSLTALGYLIEDELQAIQALNTEDSTMLYRKAVLEDLKQALDLTNDLDVIHYKLAKIMGNAEKAQQLHDWLFQRKAQTQSSVYMDRVRQAVKEQ